METAVFVPEDRSTLRLATPSAWAFCRKNLAVREKGASRFSRACGFWLENTFYYTLSLNNGTTNKDNHGNFIDVDVATRKLRLFF